MCEKKAKTKVAFVVDKFRRGGVAVVLQVLLQFLAKEEAYDITLFVRDYDPQQMRELPDGVVCLPWAKQLTLKDAFGNGVGAGITFVKNAMLSLWHFRNFGKRILYTARNRDLFPGTYDCVIAYQMIPNDVTIAALEKIRGKRKLLWLHGKKKFAEKELPFYDDLYSRADAVVCVSKDTEDHFRQLMPRCADKVMTIHNMYNTATILSKAMGSADEMDMGSDRIRLVTAARLAQQKGYERVPGTARKLKDAGYNFRWYIIGDGELRPQIETALREAEVDDCVRLLGHRENPYPYIRQCDIYVQTSHMEGFCTSTMEAKILHKPVVTTDVQGMREQFTDGENGLIVESSVDGLFEGLKKMMDSPQLRARIVNALMKEVPHNDKVLAQTRAVIEGGYN